MHVSSFVVYQLPVEGEVTEESAADTSSAGYAHTKRELEGELLRAVQKGALPATILQPTIVYGPFSRPWTIEPAGMLDTALSSCPIPGRGPATQSMWTMSSARSS